MKFGNYCYWGSLMFIALLTSAVLLAQAEPAAQPASTGTAAVAPAPAPAAKGAGTGPGMVVDKHEEFVCHTEEVLGTRLKKKVCRNKEQAELEKAESRQTLEHIQQLSRPVAGN